MRRPLVLIVALMAGLLASAAARAEPPQALPRAEIEQIVKDYLMREPEVLYQALQVLQERHDAAQAQAQQAAVVQHKGEIFARADDPVIGDPQGDVTLVEFFDYHCTYCRGMVPIIKKLLSENPKLRLVLKEFPILGPQSVTASQAALAAAKQGKYREMHFALLDAPDLSREAILQIAAAHGLDTGRLAADMDAAAIKDHLGANLQLAQALGVNGTPAFVIGDQLIPGATELERLNQLVAGQRRSAVN